MTHGLICDACGRTLLLDTDVRYVLDIRGYAAYDPLEITEEDLARDFDAENRRLIASLEGRDPQELEDEIHKEFRFDLCPHCWKRYLEDPLGGLRGGAQENVPEG